MQVTYETTIEDYIAYNLYMAKGSVAAWNSFISVFISLPLICLTRVRLSLGEGSRSCA
jgi:hypothetical protein